MRTIKKCIGAMVTWKDQLTKVRVEQHYAKWVPYRSIGRIFERDATTVLKSTGVWMNLIDYSSNADATAGKVVYVDRFMRNMTMSHLICCLLSPNVLGSSAKFDIARAAMPLLLKLGRGKGVSVEECAQKLEADLAMYLYFIETRNK